MPRPKCPDGVLATIERLTGQDPCPGYLRDKLNHYLDQNELFPPPPGNREATLAEKLDPPRTDALVMNVLNLDQVFLSKTKLITKLVNRTAARAEIEKAIATTKAEMQRRFDTYGYWLHRLDSLKSLLTDPAIDLRVTRIDEQIRTTASETDFGEPGPFALRAIQQLEQSEERGRLGNPTADEYVERAESYLALRHFGLADSNAKAALDIDASHAQAWFIRVMVAIRQRKEALNAMHRHQMVAQEIAEPMSAHESWAREMADEAGAKAAEHHEQLARILPKALLHWPRLDERRYDYRDQRTQVRNIYIDQLFSRLAGSPCSLGSRSLAELNGLGPEWKQKWLGSGLEEFMSNGTESVPLDDIDKDAITQLLIERDRDPDWFFDIHDQRFLARDLKLLHLRWVMKLNDYGPHWELIRQRVAELPAVIIEECILHDEQLTIVWNLHQAMNEGCAGVLAGLDRWSSSRRDWDERQLDMRLLGQHAVLFHHQFAREAFTACASIARRARDIAAKNPKQGFGGDIGHPFDDQITMPVSQPLYWRYLEALSVVKLTTAGNAATDGDLQLLLETPALLESFRATKQCFWVQSEEYEGGGGDEWPTEPYGLDLREIAPWVLAIRMVLNNTKRDDLNPALRKLAENLTEMEKIT